MSGQTYATHAHRPYAWNITWLIALIALILAIGGAWQEATDTRVLLLLLATAIFLAINLLRVFALRLQDRIIRLEMQVRLARLGRGADFDRLSLRQLIALRFASDAELPALIDRAVAEKLDSKQIKEAVKDWQGDYLRT